METVTSRLYNNLAQDSISHQLAENLIAALVRIKNIVDKLTELDLDPEEFAYLRLCSLFTSGVFNIGLGLDLLLLLLICLHRSYI